MFFLIGPVREPSTEVCSFSSVIAVCIVQLYFSQQNDNAAAIAATVTIVVILAILSKYSKYLIPHCITRRV